jgi:UDP-N-acetylglucosamine 2-epimerase (non-hydrolysing)
MSKQRMLVVIGTRPEAIKLAPVVRELRARAGCEALLVSTGQHREMLEQALRIFDLRPDLDLDVMTPGQSLQDITCRTLERTRTLLAEYRPNWVIVQGDTTTAFAAALSAFYQKVPVAHVEAGLRSQQRYSPFPEEINRRLVDQLSELLFAPTEHACQLLLREGFDPKTIHHTGNTVVDALLATREHLRTHPVELPELPADLLRGRKLILVTAHRRESFGGGIEAICQALLRITHDAPDTCVVYPVHLNPNVDGPVRALLGGNPRIVLSRPLPYLEFTALMDRAHLILSDSGGVQEEAPTFRKPLLVMREVTERPEGIAAGVARLVGTSADGIYDATMRLLRDKREYEQMAKGINPYGDGTAARRIADIITARAVVKMPSAVAHA